MLPQAIEDYAPNNGVDWGFEMRLHATGTIGQVVADSRYDRLERRRASAIETDTAFSKQILEAPGDHTFEQRKFVRIVVVKSDPVYGCGVDADFVRVLGFEELLLRPEATYVAFC